MEAPPLIIKGQSYEKIIDGFKMKMFQTNDSLAFEFQEGDSFPNNIYFQSFNLSELKNKSRFLSIFENLDDIETNIKSIFDSNKYQLIKNPSCLILTLTPNIIMKKSEIILSIPQQKKEPKLVIEELSNEIIKLKKELIQMKKDLYEIKNLDIIKNAINLKNYVPIIESRILSKEDSNKVEIWVKESVGNVQNYQLIHRATQNGDTKASFNHCKNIPNLLWIMKDKNNNIFGCFHTLGVNSGNNNYLKDKKCFLFSVNKNKKYYPNLNYDNIYQCGSCILELGNNSGNEFSLHEKFLSTGNISFSNGNVFNHNLELCNNSSNSLIVL